MNSFKVVKILLLVPVLLALLVLMTALGDLDLFYFSTLSYTMNFIIFLVFALIRLSPLLLFSIIVISRSNTEVEHKMTLYGIILLLYAIIPTIRSIYFFINPPRFPVASGVVLMFNIIMIIFFLSLILSSIRLPSITSALRRHRIIAFTFPLALILGNIIIINVLPTPTTYTNPEINGAISSFLYTVLSNVLLFVLVDSTERVFGFDSANDDKEQMWPNTSGKPTNV